MEIMKGRRTNPRVAEFGETILFNIPETKLNPGKFEDQWDAGEHLGFEIDGVSHWNTGWCIQGH